ncbi:FAD-dependent oxidoreductase [Clostridium estertheticum]|uniref:FAD-dependent oxidoreductase n=1 Tax=Clostridium estertheticum TaxID=238834 RepID=UPI001C7CEB7A|nr:FAD-dependent oxidoreductase [Clostridium estertheticum]MBX4264832.1 FAD-dependent oxidoreductase [Clostridium estertheticum]MBX4270938.1 FAD-dependent oxidoreductase [Clostridium estertheticum]WLC81171.1 FAD-dependent monooxygenase [Clostridium estertheticum]WLC88314.1 FAD-dependent monooxygenase [Clostridium estertheticum]
MSEKFDAIIVGAGVAGLAAAYTMSKAGLKTIVIEKGQHPGSKNVMGGVLYSHMMAEIIPDFWKDAPLERPIIEQNLWIMGKESVVKTGYKDMGWSKAPYNNFTVFRGKFDQWFAKKCVEVGTLIVNETVVKECILENNKVVGVRTDRPDGDILADVVVLADGVNSLLGKSLGFHKEWRKDQVALCVMEELKMPSDKIEERFNLDKGMGATIEIFGDTTLGMVGTAFIYTNKDHISIGCGALLSQMYEKRVKPYELLEYIKNHPMVKPLIAGSQPCEYYAHLIPEGGYKSIPKLMDDGVIVIGDAAQFVNGIHREGSNMGMTSGRFAGETIIRAKGIGDFTKNTLSHYEDLIKESYITKDLKKYKNASSTMENNGAYFNHYMPALNKSVSEMLTVDGASKSKKQKLIMKHMTKGRSMFTAALDLFKMLKEVK